MVNPLLFVLAESRYLGDEPDMALMRLMLIIAEERTHKTGNAVDMAYGWELLFGEPTYAILTEFAVTFAGMPLNAKLMARIVAEHENTMASFTPEERAEVTAYMPEATNA